MSVYQATASAPVNIACIKYWGKRDTKLILPTNSSLSVTLDQDHLRSTTTARADPSFQKDRLWLNGTEDEIKDGGRLATCIKEMKALRKQLEDKDASLPKISSYSVHISSRNNFPTAAGLASSASGFAALVASLAALYKLPTSQSDLSRIARQGSGSACRSLFGGFVAWQMGELPDGSDSLAVEIAPREHWPDIHALICVVNDEKKGTSSTAGMQRTVETSPLLQHRIKHVVPARMAAISAAIRTRDFDAFARITMQDSNQFHAVALDTEPPIFYMNDVSRAIIALIVEYNRVAVEKTGKLKAAYTYDAGPNAVIYTPKEHIKEIVELIVKYFPQAENFKDPFGLFGAAGVQGKVVDGFNEAVSKPFGVGAVKGLIHTRVGDGPRTLGPEEALLSPDGLPK
uniref:Diphosphomevalonate decarboxylase n=1 Tax=Ganoderma lucidum TaxID=5315 RepID=MVD_GANLU|nr:RecName: Full=Diphosphomevalonate decarboxylase; AltName: Full=Mevalonate pyrophosphate decarboxylase; Short=MPD; AltName: Full=Mevalonate-5-diphosphate decarboxylase; Short=MDD; Short=MDDase [Ganoderma lucidum]AEB00646.1 mevalonate pyrophosphate decarboxylase [Ganoderma lucidum]AEB00647.1 mevalonate pyrophosphate decarboxylase [Ganoderma lucidum]